MSRCPAEFAIRLRQLRRHRAYLKAKCQQAWNSQQAMLSWKFPQSQSIAYYSTELSDALDAALEIRFAA